MSYFNMVAHQFLKSAQRPNSPSPYWIWLLGIFGWDFGLRLGLGLVNRDPDTEQWEWLWASASESRGSFANIYSFNEVFSETFSRRELRSGVKSFSELAGPRHRLHYSLIASDTRCQIGTLWLRNENLDFVIKSSFTIIINIWASVW